MSSPALARFPALSVPQLLILLLGRLVFNTAFRVVYPLLPVLAGGFEVGLGTASLLVTVQVAANLLSPLGGLLSDARGERFTMIVGLLIFCCGAAICALTTAFGLFLVGYGLVGLATALYMPAVHAYASARSDYSQRGRVLGTLELSWALAALIGVSGLTQLIGMYGSWAPAFWALFVVGLVMLGLTLTLPNSAAHHHSGAETARRGLLSRGDVWAALSLIFFQLLAAELIFVVYASWLEGDFGASTEQVGLIFGLLGFVELAGSISATLFTDRIGKLRAVVLGFLAAAVFQALLPLSAGYWGLFLLLFLLFGLSFEFAIVSTFPLVSGLASRGRGTLLALMVVASGLGRLVGSLAGPLLFVGLGFWSNGLLAGVLALVGALICLGLVREGRA
jgi:predicted MFS family arabinose efflux permease